MHRTGAWTYFLGTTNQPTTWGVGDLLEEVGQSREQCLSRGRSGAFRKVKEGWPDQRSRGELDRVLARETNKTPQASLGSLNLITEP